MRRFSHARATAHANLNERATSMREEDFVAERMALMGDPRTGHSRGILKDSLRVVRNRDQTFTVHMGFLGPTADKNLDARRLNEIVRREHHLIPDYRRAIGDFVEFHQRPYRRPPGL